MLQYVELHFSRTNLVQCRHDGQLDLTDVVISFHFFVLVVAQTLNIGFKQFFQLVVGDLLISVFSGMQESGHGVLDLGLLLILIFKAICVSFLELLKLLLLEWLKHLIMFHEFEELKVVYVALAASLVALVHHAVKHICL